MLETYTSPLTPDYPNQLEQRVKLMAQGVTREYHSPDCGVRVLFPYSYSPYPEASRAYASPERPASDHRRKV